MGAFLRKYATGTGADIIVPVIKAGSDDFAVGGDWTPAAGDVKVSKDGDASANIATLPVFIADIGWKFVFSDAELTAARTNINIVDSATKAIKDQHIVIDTYGNASAQHAFDLNTATQDVNVTQISGDSTAADNLETACDGGSYNVGGGAVVAASVSAEVSADVVKISGDGGAADNLELDYDGTGYNKTNSEIGACTANGDMVGTNGALLAANVNVAAGILEANLLQIGGVAQSATDLKDFADTGYDPTSHSVFLVDTTTANTDMVGTNSAALASDLATHDTALSTHDTALGTHDTALTDHNTALTTHDTALSTHDTALGTHDTALGTHDTALGTHDTDIKADLTVIDGIVDDILVDTIEIGTAGVGLSDLGGMSSGMKTEVNAELIDVMATDTHSEIAAAAPPDSPTYEEMIHYSYQNNVRNKTELNKVTGLERVFMNDGSTPRSKRSVTDDGTTTTKLAAVAP